jgi:hypothetical protein
MDRMTLPAATDVHPIETVDQAAAVSTMAAWLTGTPVHWDPAIAMRRPELAHQGVHVGRDLLRTIRGEGGRGIRGTDPTTSANAGAVREWTERSARKAAADLRAVPIGNDGRIDVQRVMGCSVETLRASLGVFWTTDIGHGGILSAPWEPDARVEILVTARVHLLDVDWHTSLLARMDWHSGDYERELRLEPGRPLVDVRAERWDQSLIRHEGLRLVEPDLDWTT